MSARKQVDKWQKNVNFNYSININKQYTVNLALHSAVSISGKFPDISLTHRKTSTLCSYMHIGSTELEYCETLFLLCLNVMILGV